MSLFLLLGVHSAGDPAIDPNGAEKKADDDKIPREDEIDDHLQGEGMEEMMIRKSILWINR
jgi:hypothetical protein